MKEFLKEHAHETFTALVVVVFLVVMVWMSQGPRTYKIEPVVDPGDATREQCALDCRAYAEHDTASRKRICDRWRGTEAEGGQNWQAEACDQPAWLDPKSFHPMYSPATLMRPASCLCFAGHWKYPDMGMLW